LLRYIAVTSQVIKWLLNSKQIEVKSLTDNECIMQNVHGILYGTAECTLQLSMRMSYIWSLGEYFEWGYSCLRLMNGQYNEVLFCTELEGMWDMMQGEGASTGEHGVQTGQDLINVRSIYNFYVLGFANGALLLWCLLDHLVLARASEHKNCLVHISSDLDRSERERGCLCFNTNQITCPVLEI
jgi:hypothetical protein